MTHTHEIMTAAAIRVRAEGAEAHRLGKTLDDCPYTRPDDWNSSSDYMQWRCGWIIAAAGSS